MNIILKATLEKSLGEQLSDKLITSEYSDSVIAENSLSKEMVEYWAGRSYHEQERASHGFI